MKLLLLSFLSFTLMFAAIDINSANENELRVLHGVGVKKAEAIIAYRNLNCFKNIEELVKVKGIGKKTFDKNKDNLSTGTCEKK